MEAIKLYLFHYNGWVESSLGAVEHSHVFENYTSGIRWDIKVYSEGLKREPLLLLAQCMFSFDGKKKERVFLWPSDDSADMATTPGLHVSFPSISSDIEEMVASLGVGFYSGKVYSENPMSYKHDVVLAESEVGVAKLLYVDATEVQDLDPSLLEERSGEYSSRGSVLQIDVFPHQNVYTFAQVSADQHSLRSSVFEDLGVPPLGSAAFTEGVAEGMYPKQPLYSGESMLIKRSDEVPTEHRVWRFGDKDRDKEIFTRGGLRVVDVSVGEKPCYLWKVVLDVLWAGEKKSYAAVLLAGSGEDAVVSYFTHFFKHLPFRSETPFVLEDLVTSQVLCLNRSNSSFCIEASRITHGKGEWGEAPADFACEGESGISLLEEARDRQDGGDMGLYITVLYTTTNRRKGYIRSYAKSPIQAAALSLVHWTAVLPKIGDGALYNMGDLQTSLHGKDCDIVPAGKMYDVLAEYTGLPTRHDCIECEGDILAGRVGEPEKDGEESVESVKNGENL